MHDISLILLIAFGLGFALLFGLITNRLGLSPIVGYLLAGIAVSPNTPGFIGDIGLASQLAEIGVILLMFGVGLHFKVKDLLRVRGIAIPGAIGQSAAAILLSLVLIPLFGLSFSTAIVLGTAISVASTVVLIRVLSDRGILHTPEGHVAVGWLIVEDIFTVAVLVLLPTFSTVSSGGESGAILWSLGKVVVSVTAALVIVMVLGGRILPLIMNAVARTRSRELFMLSVLVVAMIIAVGSSSVFGVSMALGAFLAGLVVAQSDVGHQAAAEALPFRDAFAVLFFVSVGMLFDPAALLAAPWLTIAVLLIVIVGKPIAAFLIVIVLNHPLRTALTVAVALAQIGEFTFILADLARRLGYFDQQISSVLVTCSIISITLNPLICRTLSHMEKTLPSIPIIGPFLSNRGTSDALKQLTLPASAEQPGAIVIGYGPVGQAVVRQLEESGVRTTVIDLNVDTVRALREQGRSAVYGDAQMSELLESAGLRHAAYLVLTIPDPEARNATIRTAHQLQPAIKILARSRYISETQALEQCGVTLIVCEESEVVEELVDRVLDHVRANTAVAVDSP